MSGAGVRSTRRRLEDQIAWYSKSSGSAQRRYKVIKIAETVAAAFVPLLSRGGETGLYAGYCGIAVMICEGVLHVSQYHQNWISYRSTAEALKHEKFLYLAKAGPYEAAKSSDVLLAERVEALISQEHSKWVSEVKERGSKRALLRGR